MPANRPFSILLALVGGASFCLASGCDDDGAGSPRGAVAGQSGSGSAGSTGASGGRGGGSATAGSAGASAGSAGDSSAGSGGTGAGAGAGKAGPGGGSGTGKGGGPTVPGLRAEPGWLPYGSTAAAEPVLRMSAGKTYQGPMGALHDALVAGCTYRDEEGHTTSTAVTDIPSQGANFPPALDLRPSAPLTETRRWMLTCSVPASVATVSLEGYSAPPPSSPNRFDLVFSTGSAPTVLDATHGTVAAKTASLSITLSEPIRGGDLAGTRLTVGGVVVEGVCPNRGSSGKGPNCLQPDDDQLCGGFGMVLPPGIASGGELPLGLLFPASAKGPGGATFGEATAASAWTIGPQAALQGEDVAFTFAPSGWTNGKDSAYWRADAPLLVTP